MRDTAADPRRSRRAGWRRRWHPATTMEAPSGDKSHLLCLATLGQYVSERILDYVGIEPRFCRIFRVSRGTEGHSEVAWCGGSLLDLSVPLFPRKQRKPMTSLEQNRVFREPRGRFEAWLAATKVPDRCKKLPRHRPKTQTDDVNGPFSAPASVTDAIYGDLFELTSISTSRLSRSQKLRDTFQFSARRLTQL